LWGALNSDDVNVILTPCFFLTDLEDGSSSSNNNNYDTTGISKVGTCKGELKQVKLGLSSV
jgi:hypothetical protein